MFWLLCVNVVLVGAMAMDKFTAGVGGPRIPEKMLYLLTLGAPFGFLVGSSLFNHKTKKGVFRQTALLSICAQTLALIFFWPAL